MSLTKIQAQSYVGKYCSILPSEGGGMAGKVWKIEDGWLIVDYGYGIRLEDIDEIVEEHESSPAGGR